MNSKSSKPKKKSPLFATLTYLCKTENYNINYEYNKPLMEKMIPKKVEVNPDFELYDDYEYKNTQNDYDNLLISLIKEEIKEKLETKKLEGKAMKSNDYVKFFTNDLIVSELMLDKSIVSKMRINKEGSIATNQTLIINQEPSHPIVINYNTLSSNEFNHLFYSNPNPFIYESYYKNLILSKDFYRKYQANVKSWYENRIGVLYNSIPEFDIHVLHAWNVASGNIKNFKENKTFETLSDEEKGIINSWEKILQSPSIYLIICKTIPCNQLFNHFFNILISKSYCKVLFGTLLYPISFIFTPNMFGFDKITYGLSDCSKSQIRRIIIEKFIKIYNRKETFSSETNLLVHYLGKNEINYTLHLFSYEIFEIKEIVKKTNPKKKN